MDLLPQSQKEAKEQNYKWYFTGLPCKKDHVDKRTTSNSHCYSCTKETKLKYKKSNPVRAMWLRAKERAKKYNLEFTITLEDIIIPEICPWLGISLNLTRHKQSFDSPSLERLDSNKGYIPSNIIVVSWRANSIKNDASLEELEKVIIGLKESLKIRNNH